MPVYSEKVMEHFMNPRNVGTIENPDGVGEVGNPVCGDMMTFYIKVKGDILEDIKYQTFGCGAAIAVSSMVSEMAKGKTIDEALRITNKVVADALGGLPANKMHCSNLGAEALRKAIEDYQQKKEKKEVKAQKPKIARRSEIKEHSEECLCPYCDSSLTEVLPYCKTCGHQLKICPECGSFQPQEANFCPQCGSELKKKRFKEEK